MPQVQRVEQGAPVVLALPRAPLLTHEQQQAVGAVQPPERDPAVPGFLALPRALGTQVEKAWQQPQQVEEAVREQEQAARAAAPP